MSFRVLQESYYQLKSRFLVLRVINKRRCLLLNPNYTKLPNISRCGEQNNKSLTVADRKSPMIRNQNRIRVGRSLTNFRNVASARISIFCVILVLCFCLLRFWLNKILKVRVSVSIFVYRLTIKILEDEPSLKADPAAAHASLKN